jgi:hypothetical protein
MISKVFKGFSRRAIRIFSRSVIEFPALVGGDTRRAYGRQRMRLLDTVGFRSQADIGARSARFVSSLKAATAFSEHLVLSMSRTRFSQH